MLEDRLDAILAGHLGGVERGEDPDLEALLKAHPDLADRIRAFFADRDLIDSWSGRRSAGAFPRRFGPYVLLDEIARGGMGVVYRARQDPPGRIVALKMVLAGRFAAPQEIERFRVEAEAAARLEHPHIVPIHEVGEHDGQHFFTMQYLDGGNLAAHAERLGSDARQVARLILKVARAVAHAHERGVLHRDLKPSNVLVDAAGEPRVADFGLAKIVEGDSGITLSGSLVGTVRYMAPELTRGKTEPTTGADVYGVGLILYELLAGRPAFEEGSPLETLRQVAEMDPAPPSRGRPGVPRDLETICMKCLAKDPRRRYASAAELAADLDRFLAGKPIAARPVAATERAWMWARRRPGAAAAVAISVLAAMALVVVSLWYGAQLRAALEDSREQLRLLKLRVHADRARQVCDNVSRGELAVANRLLADMARESIEEDLEELEWRYLLRVTQPSREDLAKGVGPARWAAVHPDGRALMSGGTRQLARYTFPGFHWMEPERMPELGSLAGAFTPDGSALILVNYLGDVNAFDTTTWNDLVPRGGFARKTTAMAISPRGDILATGTEDGAVSLWHWRIQSRSHEIPGMGDAVQALGFSATGDILAVAHASGPIRLWRGAPDWGDLGPLPGHAEGTLALAFAREAGRLASVGGDGVIRIWDVSRRTQVDELRLPGRSAPLRALAFSRDGRVLAAGGDDRLLTVWDLEHREVLQRFIGHSGTINCVVFSPDDRWIVSTSEDGGRLVRPTPRLDDRAPRGEPAALAGHTQAVSMLAVSPGGREVLTAAKGERISRWDLERLEREPLESRSLAVRAIAPDGAWAVVDEDGRRLLRRLFGPQGGAETFELGINSTTTTLIAAFSSDSSRVAAFANDGLSFHVWRQTADLTRPWVPEPPCRLDIARDRPQDLSPDILLFSPDGRLLAYAAMRTWQVHLWDLEKRSRSVIIGAHSQATALAFSDDSRWLAAGRAQMVGATDLSPFLKGDDRLEPEITLCRLAGPVSSLGFSPSGRRLVTGSADGTLDIWSLIESAGTLLAVPCAQLHGHHGPVRGLQFALDGDALVSVGGADESPEILVWRSAAKEVQTAFRSK